MKIQKFKVERSTEGNIFELAFVLLAIVVWVTIIMLVCPAFIYFIYK